MNRKSTEHCVSDGPSPAPLSNQVIMQSKFQPTRGGARKRIERTETAHHLLYENTKFEGAIKEVGIAEPSPGYQARSVARQQAANPQSYKGDDSSADRSSSSGTESMKGLVMRPPVVL
ncbi:hypothetical protein HAX54_052765 [Datura stramonium]|uniref:Uncharacterized protein n=1 Tax=Datura stramonium TaxID=4076 RepID=A0ABS8WRG9_DATST|nr:hypothetical protein [Datura stramonium]